MKHLNKKQERGALLVEIMAVIALLGVMGPLLFKQVSERNEEVDNINIATEIRAVKEAFASYILAYHSELAATGIMEDTSRQITEAEADKIVTFLPEGYDNVLGHYNLYIHRKTTAVNSNQFQGFIAPNMESLGLSGLTLRRVARIANLIGADGGLVMAGEDEINGTGGAWHASTDVIGGVDFGGHVFVATTGLDTFVPEVVLEDFDQRNIQMPENQAFKRLHAYEYFSVDPGNNNNCYTNAITTTTGAMASDDTIKMAGENSCEPLFWVIAKDPDTQDSATKANNNQGFVFLKNQLHLRNRPTGISDIVLATSGSIDDDSPAQILVRGADGKTRVKIRGDGSIISLSSNINDEDIIGLQNGMLVVTGKDPSLARETTGIDGLTFKVDPARVSVMGDIRLEAMGGAKLSELLPKFNLQKVEIFNTSYTAVDIPSCPNHYYPAIVVTPASLTFPTERAILSAVEDNVIWDETTSSLIDETGKTATINDRYIHPTIVIEREKSSWSNNFVDIENANKEGRWEISVAYSNDKDDDYFTPQPISIVVQTYCVFDSSGGLGSGMYTTTDEETRNEKAKIK